MNFAPQESNQPKDQYLSETPAMDELRKSILSILSTYSNVHRGSGHFSMISTGLYEEARTEVLKYLGLGKKRHTVVFAGSSRADRFIRQFHGKELKIISSMEIGLNLGVKAIVFKNRTNQRNLSFEPGGGTAKLYGLNWVMWEDSPERFESGTPAIINIILFSKALSLTRKYGRDAFLAKNRMLTSDINALLYEDEYLQLTGLDLLNRLGSTMIGKGVQVPTAKGLQPFINLDYSASTPSFYPVYETFIKSLFQPEKERKEILNEVSRICCEMLGAGSNDFDVVFTNSTTESVNLIAENPGLQSDETTETVILTTFLEHSSNDLPWRNIPNCTMERIKVDNNGFWNPDDFRDKLHAYNREYRYGKKRIRLVSVCGASNVLGSCNNLAEIGKLAHEYKASFCVDAAQLIAHREIDMTASGIDYLVFSAHKVYAPFGTGVLISRKGLPEYRKEYMDSLKISEHENAAGVAALGKSLVLLKRIGFFSIMKKEELLLKQILQGMNAIPGIILKGIASPDTPEIKNRLGVVAFGIKDRMNGKIARKLALYEGIGIRYGCFCAHLIVKQISGFTPFLEKIQKLILTIVPVIKLQGFSRISIGIGIEPDDIDRFLFAINRIASEGTSHSKDDYQDKFSIKKTESQVNSFVESRIGEFYNYQELQAIR